MSQRLNPIGHAGILIADYDPDLAVRIRLRLSVVQRSLVVDVVERDVPEATQLEAQVGSVGHGQCDHQRLVRRQIEVPDGRVLRGQPTRGGRGATNVLTGMFV